MKYAMELKQGEIFTTYDGGKQTHKVHSTAFYAEERFGPLANKVIIETSHGALLALPVSQQYEVAIH